MSAKSYSVTASVLASTFGAWRGSMAVRKARIQPAQLIELYEFEASPYCRLVREALTEMDLDAVIYPCPKGGTRFRPQVEAMGGKQQYPFMHDPNTGVKMYESADIVNYLAKTYNSRLRVKTGFARQVQQYSAYMASVARLKLGMNKPFMERVAGYHALPSTAPAQLLELYSFESSPYSRPVREWLCEHEIPFILRSFGKDKVQDIGTEWVRLTLKAPVTGRNRTKMFEATGRTQVPYLVDANTGVAMHESRDILAYLQKTYG